MSEADVTPFHLEVGITITRNHNAGNYPTDPAFDLIQGATFLITIVSDGSVVVKVLSNDGGYPCIGTVMLIPRRYINSRYFIPD